MKIFFKGGKKGESIFLNFPSGKWGLIDCYSTSVNDILEYCENLKIKEFDFICITHPHEDHYKGLIELLKKHKVKNIFLYSVQTHDKLLFYLQKKAKNFNNKQLSKNLKYLREAHDFIKDDKNLNSLFLTSNVEIHKENNIVIKTIAPSGKLVEKCNSQILNKFTKIQSKKIELLLFDNRKDNDLINSFSGVILLEYKNIKVLFGADALIETFNDFKNNFTSENKIGIFKVSHHGSMNAMSKELLKNNYFNKKAKFIIMPFLQCNLPNNDFIELIPDNIETFSTYRVDNTVEKNFNYHETMSDISLNDFSSVINEYYVDEERQSGIIELEITESGQTKVKLHGNAIKL